MCIIKSRFLLKNNKSEVWEEKKDRWMFFPKKKKISEYIHTLIVSFAHMPTKNSASINPGKHNIKLKLGNKTAANIWMQYKNWLLNPNIHKKKRQYVYTLFSLWHFPPCFKLSKYRESIDRSSFNSITLFILQPMRSIYLRKKYSLIVLIWYGITSGLFR